MEEKRLEMLKQLAAGIAAQFGPNCEVVVHEISDKSAYSSIVAIENGQVLHAVYPQPAGGRDGDLLHQLRRIGPDDDPEHHRRSAVHPG